MSKTDETNGESFERCERCRRYRDDHAVVIVNQSERRLICPTTRGHAPSYDESMQLLDHRWAAE